GRPGVVQARKGVIDDQRPTELIDRRGVHVAEQRPFVVSDPGTEHETWPACPPGPGHRHPAAGTPRQGAKASSEIWVLEGETELLPVLLARERVLAASP